MNDISMPPSKVLNSELRPRNASTFCINDSIFRIRKTMSHCCLSNVLKLPKTLLEFHYALNCIKIVTDESEEFLVINGGVTKIICFSSQTNLKTPSSVESVFVDGTFCSCPRQLFGVYRFRNNYVSMFSFSQTNHGLLTYVCFVN